MGEFPSCSSLTMSCEKVIRCVCEFELLSGNQVGVGLCFSVTSPMGHAFFLCGYDSDVQHTEV